MNAPIQLKATLAACGLTQQQCAVAAGISRTAFSFVVNRNVWPRGRAKEAIQRGVEKLLSQHGVDAADLSRIWKKKPARHSAKSVARAAPAANQPKEQDLMLLQRHTLSPQALRHFGLAHDPLSGHISRSEDMYLNEDLRYVREVMCHTARHGAFTAIVGESGSGKTTLWEDAEEKLARESPNVLLFKPWTFGMEGNDEKGRRLKAGSVLDALLRRLAPDLARRSLGLEDKTDAAADALAASFDAGFRHCIVIEEAHRLANSTLKHLKGVFEMRRGRSSLVGVLLIGQTELREKLHPAERELREVMQRCALVEVLPLASDLPAYLAKRFATAGKKLAEVIDESGLEEMRARLTLQDSRNQRAQSILYPLAAGNLLSGAMNVAAHICEPRVTAACVKKVM